MSTINSNQNAPVEPAPINMILHCPACHLQHVDKPEGTFIPGFTADESAAWNKEHGLWDNPPHRSHLCHGCGHIWRPADVPTNGVAAIKTKGKADSPPQPAAPEPMTREFCAAFPGTAAGIINALARQIDAAQPCELTAEQINRHTLLAKDCPPNSAVMLVSSIWRLAAAREGT